MNPIKIIAWLVMLACVNAIAAAEPEMSPKARAMLESGGPSFQGKRLYTGPHRTPRKMDGLTIVGYNYTDSYIGAFSVNGAGGGNLEVSSKTSGGGGGTCCAAIPADTALPMTLDIAWKRDGQVPWCRQTILLDGPVPTEPQYLEVHFYQDGTIQAAMSEYPSPPRVKLDRVSYVKRKASGNVNNDGKYGSCGHDN
ncbi:DUF3304 domain-containing protein [Cupriavidus plantarum]|uniref:Uncharacterized protein DUF3304 n=1 Tax=Cupriavidus plantarum TaxID=942865 RepID=A0A316ENR2_9BURK|nr:DUF3304 domain-containing protein [Cupriavidus plantarum]NYI01988.1 hypothetical protein [Cupriavidus plantarum]PWK34121.1 uncharacterized protein DUF3304 [Cupriavidus plantarum]REE91294.1 uncharacterized protein DUF3304 [Cupriavidus plantarum]RLK31648.1 uncharacterized protein DUF3304 [Cupriavidus plantarum]